jgi:hypothetical protein
LLLESIIVSVAISLTIGFSYGLYVGNYKITPFKQIEKFYFRNKQKTAFNYNHGDSKKADWIYETNVDALIRINSLEDIETKRKNLINYLWGQNELPKHLPKVEMDIDDSRYSNLDNLKQINKLTVDMEYEMKSIIYFYEPINKNGNLVIYHEGHGGDWVTETKTIQHFLSKGYAVLGIAMPLLGFNANPVVDLPDFGKIKLEFHNQLHLLETDEFHPLKFYFEPITVALNYAIKEFNIKKTYLIGLSGGGWTTIVYPAIDTRISHGYSVAGANPIFLRLDSNDYFDYEHTVPEFYRIANYEELYVMSSFGENRKLVQIYNKWDTCCFSNDLYKIYETTIKNKLKTLGKGTFENYLDDTYRGHEVSKYGLKIISDSIESD